jgi:hypothetical protein
MLPKSQSKLSEVVHTCNPSTWEAEAGGFRAPGQPALHSKTLSQKEKQKVNQNKNWLKILMYPLFFDLILEEY